MNILAQAQDLIYQLLDGMPSLYQRESLSALLALFLQAQGSPLPQHSLLKSASALSRFLTLYTWSVRQMIRQVRQAIRDHLRRYRPRGCRPDLQVILDLTTLENRSDPNAMFSRPDHSKPARLFGGDAIDGRLRASSRRQSTALDCIALISKPGWGCTVGSAIAGVLRLSALGLSLNGYICSSALG